MLHDNVSTNRRLLQVVTAVTYCLLSVGICFGFAALKPILIDSGVYADECSRKDPAPCVAQEVKLNLLFTFAAVSTNVSSFPIGILLDRYGPRVTSIIGACLMMLGTIGIAASSSSLDLYAVSYAVLACSGSFLLLSAFTLAPAFPSSQGIIVSGLTGAFDASSALFLIYRLVYQNFVKVSISRFFAVYAVVPAAILLVQILYMSKTAYEVLETKLLVEHSPHESQSLLHGEEDRQQDPLFGVMHNQPTWSIITSGWFLFPMSVMIVSLVRVNFYIATVGAQLHMLLPEAQADALATFFDILLPLGGILAIPLIGYIIDHYTIVTVYSLTAGLASIVGVLSFIPFKAAQVLHILAFVVLRPWIYSILPGTVLKLFGNDRFGVLYGGIMATAGLVNLIAHPLELWTYSRFGGNFRYADALLVSVSVGFLFGTVVYMQLKFRSV
ncbi:major facilitator superfamily domain-containing protein [Protomyces lactucae-debilis]|uniref:Major facilitator superfamily domain-containing protein n=1 Tax=Protomyces lactucae-debilis TaxID=2754530 RepID=A0A1Y2F0X1_PROLT|nr:major facilitator superfamily domain-containing protein [Protomyces lactucae-debilis]ORY77357.1 major facilitator superfamily domain-containing protein [Protomyces lactucae-debilis]